MALSRAILWRSPDLDFTHRKADSVSFLGRALLDIYDLSDFSRRFSPGSRERKGEHLDQRKPNFRWVAPPPSAWDFDSGVTLRCVAAGRKSAKCRCKIPTRAELWNHPALPEHKRAAPKPNHRSGETSSRPRVLQDLAKVPPKCRGGLSTPTTQLQHDDLGRRQRRGGGRKNFGVRWNVFRRVIADRQTPAQQGEPPRNSAELTGSSKFRGFGPGSLLLCPPGGVRPELRRNTATKTQS